MRRGDLDTAATLFRTYLAETADPTYRPRADYQLARAYYGLDQYRKCLQTLDEMEAEFPKERWPQVPALRGDAEYALGNRTTAFLSWEKAWEIGSAPDRAALRERMGKALAEMSEPELREVEKLTSVPEIHEMVETALREPMVGDRRVASAPPPYTEPGDERMAPPVYEPGRSSAVPSSSSGTGISPSGRPGGMAPLPAIQPVDTSASLGQAVGPRLGALLPLTGAERAYGQGALRGLRLAGADNPTTVMLRDTGSDAHLAARLLGSLAGDPTVLAVIAPFRNEEAAAIVPLAEQFGMPLLLPANYRGPQSRYAIPVTTAPPHPVSALARYAVVDFGATRLGILYPNDPNGQATMERFRTDVESQGALVVGIQGYEPGAPDAPAAVKAVDQWQDLEGGVSAVFLAGSTDASTTLATALRKEWEDLKLLATVRLSDRMQLEEAAEGLEGAVLANTGALPVPDSRTSAGGVEAEVFDAAMLGRRALENGATTREQLLTQLLSMERYGGVESLFRVHDGKLEALVGVVNQG